MKEMGILEFLTIMALDNIKRDTEGLEWINDGDDSPERIRDNATYKAIDEHAKHCDLDSQELRWAYFDDIDEKVEDYLKEKYNSVYNPETFEFYYYDKKYNFETVEELEKYFGIEK